MADFQQYYARTHDRLVTNPLPSPLSYPGLALDLGILNHGQMTKTTLELTSSLPNYYSKGRILNCDRINVHKPIYTMSLQWH
ncbi:hypothetical protein TNCV_1758711 [Trichonephila clavipes]|nr:hypothetical protein TNCV_1758711 [Trichonephila clavipes]